MKTPEALIFDVFGTCVDWRSSVAREVSRVLPDVDAFGFADAWRAEYQPAMASVRNGGRDYVPLDLLHLENLETVAERFGVTIDDPDRLNRAWERLDPWRDVPQGLRRLARHAILAPCSNGSIAMMTRLSRYADLRWHCILGADIARDYKPQPRVYLAACAALQLSPEQVMMVAAHNDDLAAAQEVGLLTAFVPRPREHGKGQTQDLEPAGEWDAVAPDFMALSDRLFG